MGRSMMCGGVPLFACFAVLVTLTNAAIEIGWKNGVPSVYNPDDTVVTTQKPLHEKDGFLAGEETPVWFANVHFDEANRPQYSYRRLNINETPMVKESWDYWNELKKTGGFPIRKIRSINDHETLTDTEQFHEELRNVRINRFDSPSPIEKRSADSNEVVYPSILVVMDYDDVPILSNGELHNRWSAEQLVIYALAFWGTVDRAFRKVQNPRVSLRISGIVITTSQRATPYLDYDLDENTFVQALSPMIDHWRSVSRRNDSDFPLGSYDIVAHMTDKEWTSSAQQNHPVRAVASKGPPCKLTDQIGGVIFEDDLAFSGLQRAIAQISKVLGGSDIPPQVQKNFRRKWTKEILDSLSNALKNTTCMSAPKQLHQSGTPIPQILAGEFMPNGKQCEAAGYAPDAWTCWDTSRLDKRSNCHTLKCSNQHIWGVTCSEVGPTLDGSFCNVENTKICLDGKCVDKK